MPLRVRAGNTAARMVPVANSDPHQVQKCTGFWTWLISPQLEKALAARSRSGRRDRGHAPTKADGAGPSHRRPRTSPAPPPSSASAASFAANDGCLILTTGSITSSLDQDHFTGPQWSVERQRHAVTFRHIPAAACQCSDGSALSATTIHERCEDSKVTHLLSFSGEF